MSSRIGRPSPQVTALAFAEGLTPSARRTPNAVLADVAFEGCSLDGEDQAIVEVDECDAETSDGVIELRSVAFRRNALNGASAFSSRRSNCSSVEMVGVEFSGNTCGEACFARLSSASHLRKVVLSENVPVDAPRQTSALSLLHAASRSSTTVVGLNFSRNEIPGLHVTNGTLKLTSSFFVANSEGPLVRVESDSEAEIVDCVFERNRASVQETEEALRIALAVVEHSGFAVTSTEITRGSAVSSTESSARVRNCKFTDNQVRGDAGGLFASGGSLEIDNCAFKRNAATHSGGAIYVKETSVNISQLTCVSNSAENGGGCLYAEDIWGYITHADISDNSARNGGGMCIVKSSVRLEKTEMNANSANSGGGLHVNASALGTLSCVFRNNKAEEGGGIAVTQGQATLEATNFVKNVVEKDGGAVHAATSHVTLTNCTAADNKAQNRGGAINVIERGHLNATSVVLSGNWAGEESGALRLSKSAGFIARCHIKHNTAKSKGGIGSTNALVSIRSSTITKNNATLFFGGGIQCDQRSRVEIRDSELSHNFAVDRGAAVDVTDAVLKMTNVTVLANKDPVLGGGICLLEDSFCEITSSKFEKNRASYGGAVFARKSTLVVSDTQFSSCEASTGGALFTERTSNVSLSTLWFSNNRAEGYGGAMYIFEAWMSGSVVVLEQNVAGKSGGGINCRDCFGLTIDSCSFLGNKAGLGGGAFLESGGPAAITASNFVDNMSNDTGGSLFVQESNLVLERNRFQNGRAGRGGSMAVDRSVVFIKEALFEKDDATYEGGSIRASTGSRITLAGVDISKSTAAKGAAISVEASYINATDLHIVRCSATTDGGGIHAQMNASFFCSGCVFEDNRALDAGGAVYIDDTIPHGIAYQFDICRFEGNRATLGGDADWI